MALGLRIAALILFVLAAIPPIPYSGTLLAAGLACYTAADVVGHV